MAIVVFTYGTLMKGECRDLVLEGCPYLGEGVLEDYGLLELNGYPGAVKVRSMKVYGELYEIDEDLKKELDRIEGEGWLYRFTYVDIKTKEKIVKAGFYEYIAEQEGFSFMPHDGKWSQKE